MIALEVSEGIAAKAQRLLTEGRVTVVEAGCGRPGRAIVAGDPGVYELEFGGGHITCTCPSYRPCSHRRAVALVVEGGA